MAERIYKLRYLPLFEEDLSEIINYIIYHLKNQQAANDLINRVELAIINRLKNPESFEPYPSVKDRKHPYYRIFVKNFEIYYVVIEDETDNSKIMEVRRILYNKRDIRKLIQR
jgi:plasmid stabilization system protein ParE